MELKEIINCLEKFAPPQYQEEYDNAGLITGNPEMEVKGALLCLDSTEEVIDEAIAVNCNLVIAHHPILFGGITSITGKNYVERTLLKAIKNDIAIYAVHTNIDNVEKGVNAIIAEKIGLKNTQILRPKSGLLAKLYTFVPKEKAADVRDAIFAAGAGNIGNYDSCSFNIDGQGTFKPNQNANPTVGKKGQLQMEPEIKVEVLFPAHIERKVISALIKAHPYDEVAYDVVQLSNLHKNVGGGIVGELEHEVGEREFLKELKSEMLTNCIRHTKLLGKKVSRVAVCGGAGSFLLKDAIASQADVFITSDFKYHQFFDAEEKIVIADIGHYESEQFTTELFHQVLKEKFPTFALHFSKVNTNPINYI